MHFASNITRIRVRIVALALGLALTAAIVAACGSSNDNTTSGGRGRQYVDPRQEHEHRGCQHHEERGGHGLRQVRRRYGRRG